MRTLAWVFRFCLPVLGGVAAFAMPGGLTVAEARPLRRPKIHILLVDLTHIEATNGEREDQQTAALIEQQVVATRMTLLRVLAQEQPLHIIMRTVLSNLYAMASYNNRARESDPDVTSRVAGSIEQMRLRSEQMLTGSGPNQALPPLPPEYRRPTALYTPPPYQPPSYELPPPGPAYPQPSTYDPQAQPAYPQPQPAYPQPQPAYSQPQPAYPPAGPAPMSDGQFATLLQQMQRLSWGEEKIRMARDAVSSGNFFTCPQIVQLMRTTTWGEEMVKIAAALYPRAIDQQNFSQLTAALTWESERQQLRRLLGK